MDRAEELYQRLMEEMCFKGAKGKIAFTLRGISLVVMQNNVVGSLLEEWLEKWMCDAGIPYRYNKGQSSPDFWLNIESDTTDLLEVKSFTKHPNFDIASYSSFINLVLQKLYKLQSNCLLIKYNMVGSEVIIEDCWLRKIWEICSPSGKWPVKVQDKKGTIFNIRPATWYSDHLKYPVFRCLEDFLSALEEVIYVYPATHLMGAKWKNSLIDSYRHHYGVELHIPRWMDIKASYLKDA